MSDGMTPRDAILAGVRRALETADTSPVTVPRGYRDTGPADPSGMLDLFVERVDDYRAVVVRCGPDEVEQRIADAPARRRPRRGARPATSSSTASKASTDPAPCIATFTGSLSATVPSDQLGSSLPVTRLSRTCDAATTTSPPTSQPTAGCRRPS